ncbi:NAD(P)H-dependent oxidoreductase [Erwinia sp. JUb26]|uniref:NAD(P)H-dependent oxidoreductase n=1 Tax=Erwinia sp. JUb26 TaxID=2485126 RepID=UPI000F48979D|nr:NAD(P)H-dependent oxidoreductase [Erwinia sp. JUb26]ROR15031.1 putative NADPH-quinone reductase [Erwinia sp. JUb26]
MTRALIISGHPNLNESIANATILDAVATALPEAEIRYLDALYPDYRFDIAAEQQALLKADVIVWQFPLSWYALPGLMKLWIDEVFLYGFSHGSTSQLNGKKLLLSFTTGAQEADFAPEGWFGHPLDAYLLPFRTTAQLCNLDLLPPIYTCGVGYLSRIEQSQIHQQKEAAREHAARLVAAIKALS